MNSKRKVQEEDDYSYIYVPKKYIKKVEEYIKQLEEYVYIRQQLCLKKIIAYNYYITSLDNLI